MEKKNKFVFTFTPESMVDMYIDGYKNGIRAFCEEVERRAEGREISRVLSLGKAFSELNRERLELEDS